MNKSVFAMSGNPSGKDVWSLWWSEVTSVMFVKDECVLENNVG